MCWYRASITKRTPRSVQIHTLASFFTSGFDFFGCQLHRVWPGNAGRKRRSKKSRSAGKLEQLKDQKIHRLEEKLTLKNEVISGLLEENVKAKKLNGDL